MRLAWLVVWLGAITGPLFAEERGSTIRIEVTASLPKNDAWIAVRSRNFIVVGNLGEKQLRNIAVDFEEIQHRFFQVFPKDRSSAAAKATIVVFRGSKSFRNFQQVGGEEGKGPGVVYDGLDRTYIALNADEKDRRSLYHDYIDVLIGHATLPLWLREGLAEYYSNVKNDRCLIGDYRLVVTGFPIYSHERLLRPASLLPLAELFGMTEDSPAYEENDRHTLFHAESWALVHLLHDRNSIDSLRQFIALVAAGKEPWRSFREAFRTDPAVIEEGL